MALLEVLVAGIKVPMEGCQRWQFGWRSSGRRTGAGGDEGTDCVKHYSGVWSAKDKSG